VNIAEQDYPLSESSDITGGYLMEVDGFKEKNYFTTSHGLPIRIHYPDEEEIAASQNTYIRTYIKDFEQILFGANFKDAEKGPRITRYKIIPGQGVRVSAIMNLRDDIQRALALESLVIQAPVPGTSAIGFDLPNENPELVVLKDLMLEDAFVSNQSKTFVILGKDTTGVPVYADIADFPHALICGATGMGKSVCINAIIMSLLYRAKPDEVKLIMIDPKRVEFSIYQNIPHLLIPVITDLKQAAGALMWAVEEMERRYNLIGTLNTRKIDEYNKRVRANPSLGEPLPKIIIIIDELADLMSQGKEIKDPVETQIQRIAQMARAAGIHLIIGTQRPSTDIITGKIKANITTRISCKVSSYIDSNTIFGIPLGTNGAENLLNNGDMLYKAVKATRPTRLQGAYLEDTEVENVTNFVRDQVTDVDALYDESILTDINKAAQRCTSKKSGGVSADDVDGAESDAGIYNDPKFIEAVEIAISSQKISTSLLQRKLSIGYGKAAKYIDAMESIGVVSEPNGQKARDVLMTFAEWEEKLSRVNF
jgi:S-DNA-T family DNA segregation ATPase FtsK/SpoIIIE